jgi:acid phosphatase family membrane protein YuiD
MLSAKHIGGTSLDFLEEIISNKVLITCVTAWFIAQLLKIILTYHKSKKIDITRFVGSGGMPSSHTSFVMSLATSIGKLYGFSHPLFALAICFAFVVMYDAAGVRRAAGYQAKVLNMIIDDLAHHKPLGNERLKELLGHTPKEVLAGAILGIIIAQLMI